MADISFGLDPQILIGTDTINRVGRICAEIGGRALIVSEPVLYENHITDRVLTVLEDAGVDTIMFDEVPAQATADIADNVAELARGARCDSIIGLGGLKTQGISRMACLLALSDTGLFDLIDGAEPIGTCIPYVAVPTTGRDPFLFSDKFPVVDPRDRSVKIVKAMKGMCRAAVIDPALSETLSEKFAATTIFDGFGVALESYFSNRSNFISDALLEKAMEQYARILDTFSDDRVFDLISGSTNAGFLTALGSASSAPGIGTALSYALNAKFPVAKSWCSTVLLPWVMEKLLVARPERMAKVAALMGEPVEGANTSAAAELAIEGIRRRMGILGVPARLKDFSLNLDRLVPIAENARDLEFVSFSPRPFSTEDAYDLLKSAF